MARHNRDGRHQVVVTNKKSKLHLWMWLQSLMILGIYLILAKMNGWI